MALPTEAKDWLQKNRLEALIQVAEAPLHKEPEKVAKTIDVDGISEEIIQAAIELPSGCIQSIENPSTEILDEYFDEFSIMSKAYRTQGGENVLFREIAKVLFRETSEIVHKQKNEKEENSSIQTQDLTWKTQKREKLRGSTNPEKQNHCNREEIQQ